MIASSSGFPISIWRSIFSIITVGVVDQNADGQRQAAQGHHIDRLTLSICRPMMALRMESGIDVRTMTVGRQDPKSTSTMKPDQRAGGQHFMHHVRDRILDEFEASMRSLIFTPFGSTSWRRGISS